MKAATDSVKQTGEVTSHGPTMSVNFNGFTVAFAHSETEFTSFASHNIYSTITAPSVVIEVGGDLTLRGAYIRGAKVDVHVDRQLIIESIKDVNTAESESSSVSLGVSVNWAGQFAPSVSVAAADSMQNSELVHFISGISGADVKVVAQEIKLKGAEIFGTEKLNIEGKVTVEDVEEIKESSSSHMGFSFDPIKGQGLTSINFGIGEKHDNGVVHSGVGAEATHESTDKGGYTLSLLGNNVLVRGFKEAYNWLTEPTPTPANDVTPPVVPEWVDPDQVVEEESSEGDKSENQEESEEKNDKKKGAEEKVENGGMSPNPNYKEPKTWEDYLTKHTPIGDLTPEGQKAYSQIASKIDGLNLSDADKAKYQKAAYKLFVKMENADAVEKIEIMQSLANAANGRSKGSFGISDANAYAAVLTKLPYLAELLASSAVAVAINKYLEDHPITWKGFSGSHYDGEVHEKKDNKAKAAKKEMAGGYGSPSVDPGNFEPEDEHKQPKVDWHNIKTEDLKSLGEKGNSYDIREVIGTEQDARALFDNLRKNAPIKEVSPGVFITQTENGGIITYRAISKSGPATIDLNNIVSGLRKIKFIQK